MRKFVDDVRLIFKCCSLYYQDGVGQKEICQHLGISRPTVSRMLSLGKELGIVKIEIKNPDNEMYGQLERKLEKGFGLKEVIIVPSSPLIGGKERINSDLGRATIGSIAAERKTTLAGYINIRSTSFSFISC